MLPDAPVVLAYLARGARLWVVTRAALSAGLAVAETDPFHLSVTAVLAIIAMSVAVAFVDVRRQHESVLLANLAVSPAMLGTLFLIPAVLGEIVLHAVAAALV